MPGFQSYYLGKDQNSCACLLITTAGTSKKGNSPIKLQKLEVQFQLPCIVRDNKNQAKDNQFTVIRCNSHDQDLVHYFLSICSDTLLQVLGDEPLQSDIADVVYKIAAIFQKMQKPPVRTVNGLFGELYLISCSTNPITTLSSWRIDDAARFDFVDHERRIDVKVTSSRIRTHIFSYDQCNPPTDSISVAASMFIERLSTGVTIQNLINYISEQVCSHPDLVFKLHDVTISTLGNHFNEAMGIAFDVKLARSSLNFFDLTEIPAVRNDLPIGVSDLKFRSDLSATPNISIPDLISLDPKFENLLPGRTIPELI